MFRKPYLCARCRKKTKSTNKLSRYLNACKSYIYPRTIREIQQKYHKVDNVLGENWENKVDLQDENDHNTTTNGFFKTLIEDALQKGLLANEFWLVLREEQFSNYEFLADKSKSDKKYRHPGSKHKSTFYLFNDQLDYALAHYFAESETTKGNLNKFLTDPLRAPRPSPRSCPIKILINGEAIRNILGYSKKQMD